MKTSNKFKLKDVCSIEKGTTGIKSSKPGPYPLVVTAEGRLTSESFQFDSPAVCIPLVSSTGHGHASINRIHFQSGKFALGSILAAVRPKAKTDLNIKYLYYYLSVFKDEVLVPLMKGGANVSLTVNKLEDANVIVPGVKIQEKIVSMGDLVQNLKQKISYQKGLLRKYEESLTSHFDAINNGEPKLPIGDIFNIEKGLLQSSKNIDGEFNFITASSEWKKHNQFTHDCEAIIFAAAASGSLGRVHYANGKFIASDLCFILTPKEAYKKDVNLKFYYYYLNSNRESIVRELASGGAKLAINMKNFRKFNTVVCTFEKQQAYVEAMEKSYLISQKLLAYQKTDERFYYLFTKEVLSNEINTQVELNWFGIKQGIGAVLENLATTGYERGEMVIAKLMYLLQEVKGVPFGLNFVKHRFGPYDPNIKKAILSSTFNKDKFFKVKGSGDKQVFSTGDNFQKLISYNSALLNQSRKFLTELSPFFSKESSINIELLATICKIIQDNQTIDLETIQKELVDWKGQKFTSEAIEKTLQTILENNLAKLLIKNTVN